MGHTLGPWTIEDDAGPHVNGVANGKPAWVCDCGWRDARLIAAAPEMLEALKQCEPYFAASVYATSPAEKALRLVRAAIAKAENREESGRRRGEESQDVPR